VEVLSSILGLDTEYSDIDLWFSEYLSTNAYLLKPKEEEVYVRA
jgi:hypothetical protein